MKHRGPGSSLRPAREAARAQARAVGPGLPRPTSGGDPLASAAAVGAAAGVLGVVGEWVLEQHPDSGDLVARHDPTGVVRVLAAAPQPPTQQTEPVERSS